MSTDLARLQVQLSGVPVVGPSVMTFYSSGAGVGLPAGVKAFISSFATAAPSSLTFTVPNGGDLVNDADGTINGSWTASGGGDVSGSNNTGFTLGSGLRVEWRTGSIVRGRHVRGRTFIVPMGAGIFDSSGRVSTTFTSAMLGYATTLITQQAGALCIWTRPSPKGPGTHSAVTQAVVPTVPTALRSRRY